MEVSLFLLDPIVDLCLGRGAGRIGNSNISKFNGVDKVKIPNG
jgi:hypothetical protein